MANLSRMRHVQQRRLLVFDTLQRMGAATITQVAAAIPTLPMHQVRNALRDLDVEGAVASAPITPERAVEMGLTLHGAAPRIYQARHDSAPCCRLCAQPLSEVTEAGEADRKSTNLCDRLPA